MSLRRRLLSMLIFVIVLTVALILAASYIVTQRQLDNFVSELGRIEANDLARQLSRAYTAAQGWRTVDAALAASGYLYEDEGEHQEETESGGGEGGEGFHIDRLRVVVVDLAGRSIRDNFAELEAGQLTHALSGQRREILDLRSGQVVGFVHLDVDQNFLETESSGFLRDLLLGSGASGLFILIIALSLATSFSRRISAPISALTKATQAIAQRDDATLLPVTSNDELGQMSAAFNQMTSALQRQRRMRKRLLDDVSHELNTPLTVIQLEAKGLQDELQSPAQAADNIIEEVNMLRNLVNDLDWLAETDTGDLQLQREACSLGDLLISEVERWQPQAQARQISLSLQPLPPLPTLHIDPLRIRQALGNIIQNALKHSEAERVRVEARSDGDARLDIAVTDDGAGIATTDIPHIYERLVRSDQYRLRASGLGLDIARAIMEAHGGTIAVHCDGLGRGTRVRLRLPLRADSSAPT